MKEANAAEAEQEEQKQVVAEDSDDEFQDANDEAQDDNDEEFKDAEGEDNSAALILAAKEREERAIEVIEKSTKWQKSTYSDDQKDSNAGYYGGFQLTDQETSDRLRSAAGELLKMVGQKLLSGDFNLTKTSFPIKCMCAKTMLQTISLSQSSFPMYINVAAAQSDPIERMKLLICANFSAVYFNKIFEKPLNPILGETYQCFG